MDTRTGKIVDERDIPHGQESHYRPLNPTPVQRVRGRVGRNEICPCGSGKKFKKCCLQK